MLHYTDTVKGSTALVFLHYFGGSANTWLPIIDKLKDQYRCIAIDMLGFGKSTVPQKPSFVADNTIAVNEVLLHLKLPTFFLVGHSMGGKIALSVAASNPTGLKGLVLIAPSPPTPEPIKYNDRLKLDKAWQHEKRITAHIKSLLVTVIPQVWLQQTIADNMAVSNYAWQGWLYIGSKEDISAQIKNLQMPLTVVCASEDKGLTTSFLSDTFKGLFEYVNVVEIENCGHLIPLEKPDELADIIKEKVQQV